MSDDPTSREPPEYQYSPVAKHSIRRWSGEMSVIVLDTSVLVRDPFWKGAAFHALHAACLVMRGLIAIPEVVIEELIANYRDKLRDAFRKLAPLTRESLGQSEVDGRHRDFLAFVDELRQGRTILPYPQISHQAIVKRIYEGKRPFHNGEVGYKDFLIWRSVVELLATYNEQSTKVVFISANAADFAASKSEPNAGLHAEYLDELTAADRERLSYFTSVESYTRSVLGDGFADFAKEQLDGANALRVKRLPGKNAFLAQNRPDRRYATYEADDLDFTISYVQELPDGLFAVSGIMDFMPCWHANASDQQLTVKDFGKSDALLGDNNWDAHVTLIVDQQLRVLKADIDGEAVAL
ncbi:MAG TPA: PIN domain-containing protein [Thermoanaerobaculia bacterium]|nr:PIN domain-containing protein [Thermoanaerobaculia bacterium]